MVSGEQSGSGSETRTTRNVDEHLSDVLRVRQRFEGFRPFLDDDSEGPSFMHVVLAAELGVGRKQTCTRLESRVFSENDIFRIMHLGKVVGGPNSAPHCLI